MCLDFIGFHWCNFSQAPSFKFLRPARDRCSGTSVLTVLTVKVHKCCDCGCVFALNRELLSVRPVKLVNPLADVKYDDGFSCKWHILNKKKVYLLLQKASLVFGVIGHVHFASFASHVLNWPIGPEFTTANMEILAPLCWL